MPPAYLTTANNSSGDVSEFEVFNQLTRLVGRRVNSLSTFVPNESLIQTGGEATFHSFQNVAEGPGDYLYVTNVINNINVNEVLSTDRDSDIQTQFNINEKYDGELVRDSGEILYIENVNTIQRRSTQTELVKLILEF